MVLPQRLDVARPAAVAAGLGCLLMVVAAGQHALPRPTAPQPFYLAAGGAFASYVAGVALLRRRPPRLWLVLALAAAIQLAPLARPLLLSQDALAYWAYARVAAIHDRSPYATVPARFPHDPGTRAMSSAWRTTPSVYGPLFTAAAEAEAAVAGPSPISAASFYKTAAAVGMLVATMLAAVVSRRPALAAAAVGWNPLFAVSFAGGGHNDIWMTALLLAGLALERRGRRHAAAIAWVAAAGVKWIPLLLLPLHARRRFGWAGLAGGAALLAAAGTVLYGGSWADAFLPLARHVAAGTRASLLRQLGLPAPAATVVGSIALALVYARLARRPPPRLGRAACALLLCTPWLLPWYAVWALPLAAAEDDDGAVLVAVALSGYLLLERAPL